MPSAKVLNGDSVLFRDRSAEPDCELRRGDGRGNWRSLLDCPERNLRLSCAYDESRWRQRESGRRFEAPAQYAPLCHPRPQGAHGGRVQARKRGKVTGQYYFTSSPKLSKTASRGWLFRLRSIRHRLTSAIHGDPRRFGSPNPIF